MKLGPLLLFAPLGVQAGQSAIPYSTRMIRSVMHRQQGIVSSGAASSTLESGVLALALEAWIAQYPSSNLTAEVTAYLDSVLASIAPSLANASADAAGLPLDRLSVGQALYSRRQVAALGAGETLALAALNASLAAQAENAAGGFWYYVYPDYSYLDGVVSFLPFMIESGWDEQDMIRQLRLLWTHCRDNASGLLVHGYDYSRTAAWADPATGASPFVWGRSLGWYLAGLVDARETLAGRGRTQRTQRTQLTQLAQLVGQELRSLVPALLQHADSATGAWWQLPTYPGAQGNYLESSSTALFIFALLKATRLGVLSSDGAGSRQTEDAAKAAALKAYRYAVSERANFVVDYGNGTLGWNQTVSVCSLNSTASYDYYVGRPILYDSLLGEAAFVLASLEVERLG